MDKERIKIYIAGFFDGEGCISLKGGSVRISIVNRDKRPVELISKLYKGSLYKNKAKRSPLHGDTFRVQIDGMDKVYKFLNDISPFMIVKREAAFAARDLLNSRINKRPLNHLTPLTKHELSLIKKIKIAKALFSNRALSMNVHG